MHVPPKGATAIRYPGVRMAVGTEVTISDPLPQRSFARARSQGAFRKRAGVTLLELLVVLVVVTVSAAIVLPALRPPAASPTDASDALVAATRRTAIARGEPVRLRLDADGTWGVIGARTGTVIDTGRVEAHPRALDITVDPRGTCTPVGVQSTAGSAGGMSFDPLACRTNGDRAR